MIRLLFPLFLVGFLASLYVQGTTTRTLTSKKTGHRAHLPNKVD